MTERITHEGLAKDLYILTGQVQSYGAQMEELRDLLTSGFRDIKHELTKMDDKLGAKVADLEKRVRETETAHASQRGAHSVIGWVAISATGVISTVITWLLSHFTFK